MNRIGARLVQERRLALLEGIPVDDAGKGLEYGKDLLSLLVKANMTDPEASTMSDEDVQDRGSTPHPKLVSVPHLCPLSVQKSPHLSSPVTRRAAPVSLGVFTVYPTTSTCRSVCVTRFTTSVPIHRTRRRSSLSSTSITL